MKTNKYNKKEEVEDDVSDDYFDLNNEDDGEH